MHRQLERIISGGQTGVDRAALDWARKMNISHGGWCPKGRLAEDGNIPSIYLLDETPSSNYAQRTEWNVKDSDATLIFSLTENLIGGTALTKTFAIQYHKPLLHLYSSLGVDISAKRLIAFIDQHSVKHLNLAGPRQSEEPDLDAFVNQVLDAVYKHEKIGK